MILVSACASHRFILPSGAGEPAPDAASAWTEATNSCRRADTLSGELRVSGHIGSRRVRGTIQGAVTSSDRIRLEMPAPFGPPAFILAGTADHATLLLPRDNRVLTARAEDTLEALIGLKLGPRRLLALLSGCGDPAIQMTNAARYGDLIAIGTADGRVFLRQHNAHWQVAAAEVAGLIVDYPSNGDASARALHVASAAGRTPVIALSVSLSQIELNSSFGAGAFAVTVPAGAAPLTLEELRAGGPLGGKRP